MTLVHIHAPAGEHVAAVHPCPTCQRPRRMHGWRVEWYGTTWTCAGCGDSWADGERLERPFARGWRQRSIADARAKLASIGVQA